MIFRRKILDRSTDDFISNLSCDSSDGENCESENIEVERQIFRRKLREPRNETKQTTTISKQQSAPTVACSQQQAINKQQSNVIQNQKSNESQSNQSKSRKKSNWKFWF